MLDREASPISTKMYLPSRQGSIFTADFSWPHVSWFLTLYLRSFVLKPASYNSVYNLVQNPHCMSTILNIHDVHQGEHWLHTLFYKATARFYGILLWHLFIQFHFFPFRTKSYHFPYKWGQVFKIGPSKISCLNRSYQLFSLVYCRTFSHKSRLRKTSWDNFFNHFAILNEIWTYVYRLCKWIREEGMNTATVWLS